MANKHFGNLADVFKHLALAEIVGMLRPAEYWESHSGAAVYQDPPASPGLEHGIMSFRTMTAQRESLGTSHFGRVLGAVQQADAGRFPGSPMVARMLMSPDLRRMLFCDLEAESLLDIRRHLPAAPGVVEIEAQKIECVPDDGVGILRGAGMLLPAPWAASTVVFLDPYEMEEVTAAGISSLELACELANRSLAVVLFYGFADDGGRVRQRERISGGLERARMARRGGQWFEGSMKQASVPTQWGFGLLTLNVPGNVLLAVDARLSQLEAAYEEATIGAGAVSGAWRYQRAAV